MATPDPQGQSPKAPSNIPAPGSLPKLPQTIFFFETDHEKVRVERCAARQPVVCSSQIPGFMRQAQPGGAVYSIS
jgi:hypothetical protein